MGQTESSGKELTETKTAAEVAEHKHKRDCWVIIDKVVYDVTDFLEDHPGGASIILDVAGAYGRPGAEMRVSGAVTTATRSLLTSRVPGDVGCFVNGGCLQVVMALKSTYRCSGSRTIAAGGSGVSCVVLCGCSFEAIGHSDQAKKLLQKYAIAKLQVDE